MSKLDDIDYLIGLVYEHLYMKIPVRPIESKPLSTNYLEDLTIIKKMYEGKQLDELINIIFNTNLSYSGKGESAYKFKRVDQVSDILLRQYPTKQENNPSNSLNVDKIIAYILSDLVIHKKTMGIMINICNCDIPAKELEIFTKKYPEIKLSGMISVTIREHFYKLVSLKECLKKDTSLKNYKNCIFQVLHTLDVIQSMYPTFRHNNLTIDTIMVYLTNDKTLKFKVSGKEFVFESIGEIKITNFLKSNMKDYITNDSLESKLQEPNLYYDVDMFLESLLELEPPKEISEFIKNVTSKKMNVRDILMTSNIFKVVEKDDQLGGKSKSNSRSSSRKSSIKKSKKTKKYNISQKEVDEILNIETPVEETLKSLEEQEPIREPRKPKEIDMGADMINDLKTKQHVTNYNMESINNKMPQKPITIPGLDLQFTKQEYDEPIIEVNIPKPVLQPNGLSGLLGNPDEPSGGIANGFGAAGQVTNFNMGSGQLAQANNHSSIDQNNYSSIAQSLRKQQQQQQGNSGISQHMAKLKSEKSPESNIPLNVIPNPFKKIDNKSGLGGLFGDQEQSQYGGFKGGSDRIIPIYKNNSNSPYQTNEQSRIKKERYIELHPEAAREENPDPSKYEEKQTYRGFAESKPAFSINVAPELLPPKQRPLPPAPPENVVKMMNYIIPNSFGNQTYSLPNQFAQPSANVMSQNTYNISFANPSRVREFREDILPSKDESMLKYTMNTIGERLIIYNYIRSILIRQSDGENINFLSDKSPEVRNLLSYLRILDVEVTKYDKVKNNALGNLPRRLIIYKSCYPIRVDRANYNVGCAKNNIGINIRIYQMILGETFVNKYKTLPYKVFELWREIAVYEQMRDNIVKSNMSPNFTILYSYYITQDTEINFLKINRLRNKNIINKKEKEQKFILNDMYKNEMKQYLVGLQKYSTSDLTKLVEQLDIHKPSDKCLIALTESGTQDLISWGSRQYEDNGLAKKMINTGFHSYEIWLSILFQMYHSFLCMYKFGISFQKFDLNSNVQIKSLKQNEMNKGYWKYRVNGIEFYIPNYGYMVMINSDFADIVDNDEQTLMNQIYNPETVGLPAHIYGMGVPVNSDIVIAAIDDTTTRKLDKACAYKIYSDELLVHKTAVNMSKNKLKVLSNMKDAFNPNTFNKEFTLNGGILPDDSILRIINDVNVEISKIIRKEEPLVQAAETAESAAINAGLKENEAIDRVVTAATQIFRLVRDTTLPPPAPAGNPAAEARLVTAAQISLEQVNIKINLLKDAISSSPPGPAAAAVVAAHAEVIVALNAARLLIIAGPEATINAITNAVNAQYAGLNPPSDSLPIGSVVDIYNYYGNQIPNAPSLAIIPGVLVPAPVPNAVAAAYFINNGAEEPVIPALNLNVTNLVDTMILKFKEFLHNRVGTSLKESELDNVEQNNNISVGDLVCTDVNRWGIITNKISTGIADTYTYKVITVPIGAGSDNNIKSKLTIVNNNYNAGDLTKPTILIEQTSKPNEKLSNSDILETYEFYF